MGKEATPKRKELDTPIVKDTLKAMMRKHTAGERPQLAVDAVACAWLKAGLKCRMHPPAQRLRSSPPP